MAEIPVERKEGGGFPWWLIPLLLLLLLLPLLYFTCGRNDNSNTNNSNYGNANRANLGAGGSGNSSVVTNANNSSGMSSGSGTNANSGINGGGNSGAMSGSGAANGNGTSGARNAGSVINDVNYFGGESDKSKLVGRGLFVNGVKVDRVLSDKVFTVKSGSGEMYVMLGDNLDTAGGKEKQIKIQTGQTINLGGEFRNVPTGETTQEKSSGGLNQKEYAQMKGQQVYLHANSVADAK